MAASVRRAARLVVPLVLALGGAVACTDGAARHPTRLERALERGGGKTICDGACKTFHTRDATCSRSGVRVASARYHRCRVLYDKGGGSDRVCAALVHGDVVVRPLRACRAQTVPVEMQPTPRAAVRLCRRLRLIAPACPTRVPVGRYGNAHPPPGYRGPAAGDAIASCANARGAQVAIGSGACRDEAWILEAGAPAGLPPDAPPGLQGRHLGPRRTRPPQYVHIIIYATRGDLAHAFPFAWPQPQAQPIADRLLRSHRAAPVSFGRRAWSGRRGTLVLAPPLAFGGENGDHLIFRWKVRGVDRAVSIHAWGPLREAVATLEAVVSSASR